MPHSRRILIISVGSRGDAEPFCALANQLTAQADNGDISVDLFLQKDLAYLAPQSEKIQCHELPFTQMDFYKYAGTERVPPQAGAGHPNPRVRFLGIVTDCMGHLVLPCLSQIMSVAGGDEMDHDKDKPVTAIVASSLARQVALEVSCRLSVPNYDVPVYLVQLQSLVPTRDFPHYSSLDQCVQATTAIMSNMNNNGSGDDEDDDKTRQQEALPKDEYFESYIELERHQFDFLKVHAQQLQTTENDNGDGNNKNNFEWDFERDMIPALTGHSQRNVWMVNAVSRHIVPAPSDAGAKVLNVGGLAASYIPSGFEPPAELIEFLERHTNQTNNERPICFGYGSMPFGQAKTVVNALYKLDRPAVLVGSAMMGVTQVAATGDSKDEKPQQQEDDTKEEAWIKDYVHIVSNVPYPWLLPQCSMMFCHGGAGVVHATLRAGIPVVISPLIGDQFYFAKYLEALGWGVQASATLGSLTEQDIMTSIGKADELKLSVRAVGEAMRQDDKEGPHVLANAIRKQVMI